MDLIDDQVKAEKRKQKKKSNGEEAGRTVRNRSRSSREGLIRTDKGTKHLLALQETSERATGDIDWAATAPAASS